MSPEELKKLWEEFNSYPSNMMLEKRMVADLLQTTEAALRVWRRRGIGPEVIKMPSGVIRYPVTGLRRFVQQLQNHELEVVGSQGKAKSGKRKSSKRKKAQPEPLVEPLQVEEREYDFL